MHCIFNRKDGDIDSVMCGDSHNGSIHSCYNDSNQWCNNSSSEKMSYWSNRTHEGYPDCYSAGAFKG